MHGRNALHCITSVSVVAIPCVGRYLIPIPTSNKYRSEVREANIARHRTRRSVLSNLNGSSIKLPNAAFSRACNAM